MAISTLKMADLFLVPYVRSVWEMLRYRLGASERMCLFGAGAHTRWLLSVTQDLPRPPIECILDDDPVDESLAGIAVRRPGQIDVEKIALILLSSDRWEEELAARCRALWGDRVEVIRLYEGLPCGPYDKTDVQVEALRRVRHLSVSRPTEPQQLVVVSDQPRSREAKIGWALRHAGWRPVLLHRRPATFDASNIYEQTRSYSSSWEALRLACDYSPVVYHIMVNSDYRVAELFVRHRPGAIVVDSYDLVAGMYTDDFLSVHPDFADEIERERRCLEQADGICCRSREADLLEEKFGYQYRRRLPFADGCWNEAMPGGATTTRRLPEPQARARGSLSLAVNGKAGRRDANGELHVVYAGKVALGTDAGSESRSVKRQRFATCGCDLTLARGLAQQAVHFHVFPSPDQAVGTFEESLTHYCDLDRTSRYFHLHDPVPADEVVEKLSRYDLAISIYPELIASTPCSCENPFSHPSTGVSWGVTQGKLRFATSNKFYDYIDAGLPIIHNVPPGSYLAGLVERHGIGVDVRTWPFDEWGGRLREIDLKVLRTRVARARQDYDVRRHVGQLVEFYQCVRSDVELELTAPVRPTHANSRSRYRQAVV